MFSIRGFPPRRAASARRNLPPKRLRSKPYSERNLSRHWDLAAHQGWWFSSGLWGCKDQLHLPLEKNFSFFCQFPPQVKFDFAVRKASGHLGCHCEYSTTVVLGEGRGCPEVLMAGFMSPGIRILGNDAPRMAQGLELETNPNPFRLLRRGSNQEEQVMGLMLLPSLGRYATSHKISLAYPPSKQPTVATPLKL